MPMPIIDDVIAITVLVGQPISPVPIPMRDGAAATVIGLFAAVPTLIVAFAIPAVIVRATSIAVPALIARTTLIAISAVIVRATLIAIVITLWRAVPIALTVTLRTTCRALVPFLSECGNRCTGQGCGDEQRNSLFHALPRRANRAGHYEQKSSYAATSHSANTWSYLERPVGC